ncbi:non-hydrolyzing UDP-N-acetylglucosamine 2-epimerase [Wolinella succinogenes]|uniref:non-hydrolyzing UDP-N-acetylglucosamine 2-epimerase n=1 Tax=Wolinella succinogenes TaxID=844 RepID=UPI002FC9EC76
MGKKIHLIAAARPNFMKIAPLYHEIKKHPIFDPIIVHTGQHYDANMSDAFFNDLKLPSPHFHLGIGGGSHSEQVGRVMMAYEDLCQQERPDMAFVVGDVNATMACAITAKKLHLPVVHLEAGLRSFDMRMPEEVNRIVTDAISDYFLTPSKDADENLLKTGVNPERIIFVGNIMIDSLEMLRSDIRASKISERMKLHGEEYAVVTLHRPSNVDDRDCLMGLILKIKQIAKGMKIIFPVHPRTRQRLDEFGIIQALEDPNVIICEPMGYKEFMNLVFDCKCVITDSGGIQEETTYLAKPCLTLRENTERPITVSLGTNTLVCADDLLEKVDIIRQGRYKKGSIPPLWDGNTAKRVVDFLYKMDK